MATTIQQCVQTSLFGEVCDTCDGGAIFKILAECIEIASIIIGAMAIIGIIIAGIMYITSAGNVTQQTKAKRRLTEITIGILCYGVLFAFAEFLIPGGIVRSTLDSSTTSCPKETSSIPTNPENPSGQLNPSTVTNPDIADSANPGSQNNNSNTNNDPATIEHGTRPFTMCGKTFNVIKIQVDGVADDGTDKTGLKKFIKDKVRKYHLNQSDHRLYDLNGNYSSSDAQDGNCDKVSRNLAYDMYFDTITADACSTSKSRTRGGFRAVTGDKGFKKMYDDLMKGYPVVHRVTINNGAGSQPQRHYAVVVGVRQGADRNHLKTDDFLVLETFNGVLWNNDSSRTGGNRSNDGGSTCSNTNQNRFVYDTYYYTPNKKSGSDRKDCGI